MFIFVPMEQVNVYIAGLLTGFVIGGVIMVLVYRNNKKKWSQGLDKVDKIVDVIKEK